MTFVPLVKNVPGVEVMLVPVVKNVPGVEITLVPVVKNVFGVEVTARHDWLRRRRRATHDRPGTVDSVTVPPPMVVFNVTR